MANSIIGFVRHKILLFMVVLRLMTVSAIIIKRDCRLLDNEPDDLLYYVKSHHQWHLCNINRTAVDIDKFIKNGYISNDCYSKNFKKNNVLKYAIFLTGSSDKHLGPPMCPPLKSGESYDWRCEKDMLSSAVTPYRNCTSVCKEGFYTVNNVTVRCSFTLDWIWFGDDTTPRCESGSPSTKVIPSNPNGHVYTTTTLTTDFNWILKNLTSLLLNSTSTWMVSLHQENPFPRIYRLSYRVRGETTHKEMILNGDSVIHTLTNLQKETVYDIKLCALGNQDKKFCINTTIYINADKPVTQHSETNSKVYAVIIGGSIAGAGLICTVVILAMYCYCKKNRSRGPYIAVPVRLSSSSSRSSQYNPGIFSFCLQVLNGDISLDDGQTEETSESTETGTSSYEDKNENNNASSSNMNRENVILVLGKDTDKKKKHVDSGRDKEQLEDLSSELSENKNSGKTDVSQPADSGGETFSIHLQKNERQLEDASSEFSENENSRKIEESQPVDSGGEICKIDSKKNEKQSSYLSSECSKYKNSRKNEKSQPVDSGSEGSFKNDNFKVDGHSSMDKEGDSLALESAPSLSSLMGESSGYASGKQIMSFDLNRDDNRSHDTENIGGSSVSNNMVAMEHIPGPRSIQEYGDDHVNQLSYGAQGVNPIVKPDSFDFNRDQGESFDQYQACEQKTYCDQQFPRDQRSSSPFGITLSDPGHVGRSQSSTFVDILQNEETFPTVDGVDVNITNAYKKKNECMAENAQLRGHQIDSEEYSNQMTPCCSMNSVTHNEEDIYRRHPARLPTHECQEPCINHDCPTNNAQIYTYPASSEKEDKVQRSSRCQSLPSVIPQRNATNCNIQRSGMASTMCTLSVEKAKEELSPEFFQTLAYQLDPDSVYGNAKSWYGLTLVVLHWSEEKVKSIRHHTMGNIERGHFHATLEAYTAEHKFMSDIVKYFVQPSSLRPDIIQFIKLYHTDCPVCNALYLQVNRHMSMSQSTQDIIEISTYHHKNNS